MVDSSPSVLLPASVFLQPMVVPAHAVNVNNFRILVQNQSLKETIIPVGTVIGHMYLTESVMAVPREKTPPASLDTSRVDFGDSPVSEEWKERLKQKL